ncbi:MAG: hypothetical protein ACJ73S_19025 [Mycobacteriales bacterium]|jgi:hypothetical protein
MRTFAKRIATAVTLALALTGGAAAAGAVGDANAAAGQWVWTHLPNGDLGQYIGVVRGQNATWIHAEYHKTGGPPIVARFSYALLDSSRTNEYYVSPDTAWERIDVLQTSRHDFTGVPFRGPHDCSIVFAEVEGQGTFSTPIVCG